ncbi:alpha/beta-hydrolase [Martensiomyces pterosporus]|nr:alpha/beta-hydrolase [Martensiomyces pterosporus]
MDPLKPESFSHKHATVNGIRMHYVDEGVGPKTILCIHGFPDLWYGWRFQIPYLVSKGYRVIVPDVRGYGQTDAPSAVEGYTSKGIASDMVALLDVIGVHKVILAGHDWGGMHVWRMAMWYPERVIGAIVYCTPYTPTTAQKPSLELIAKANPNWMYQLYFRSRDSIKALNNELPLFLTALFRTHNERAKTSIFSTTTPIEERTITDVRGIARSSLLSEAELQYYISEYQRHGIEGPTNYYRVHEMTWQEEHDAGFLNTKINLPCMMVTAGKDAALPAEWTKGMEDFIPTLMRDHIENSSHWVLVEQKELANAALGKFLSALETKESKL